MPDLPLALDPAGPQAEPVALLSWVLFAGGALILLLVLALMALALFGPARWKARLAGERMILIGGLAFPLVVLSVLLVVGLTMTASLAASRDEDMLTVRVTGLRWWWRIEYPGFQTANELVIPVGVPVRVELRSEDVLHSFWIPRLSGKRDLIPGKDNSLVIEADAPGVYEGFCAEYCGTAHALMQLRTVALAPADYARWAARQSLPAPPPPPEAELAVLGAHLFQTLGCGSCHFVQGTRANGRTGPDLSHVASRAELGAGILPNNIGTLAGWTANPEVLKPGVLMPGYANLSARELRALAAYMDGLE